MPVPNNSLSFSEEKVYEMTYPSFVTLMTQAGKDQGVSDINIQELLAEIPYRKICSGVVKIMNDNLSDNALIAIDEFYTSPAGKEIVSKMPRIYAESYLLGIAIAKNMESEEDSIVVDIDSIITDVKECI